MSDLSPHLWKTCRCGGSHRHVWCPKHSKDASDRSKQTFPSFRQWPQIPFQACVDTVSFLRKAGPGPIPFLPDNASKHTSVREGVCPWILTCTDTHSSPASLLNPSQIEPLLPHGRFSSPPRSETKKTNPGISGALSEPPLRTEIHKYLPA